MEISNTLNNLIKPVTLYFFVSQKQHNVLTYYKKHKGLEEPIHDFVKDVKINEKDVSNEEFSDASVNTSPSTSQKIKKNELIFDIKLTTEEWCSIKPVKNVYKYQRERLVLQEGWPVIMRKYIWDLKKLPCAFSFDRHCVNDSYSYITMVGHCTTCNSKINIKCHNEPTSDEVTFTAKTKDTRKIPHTKKKSFAEI